MDKIKRLRDHADRIDMVLITALAERMSLIPVFAKHKKQQGITAFDHERENEILSNVERYAEVHKLDSEFVKDIFSRIIDETKAKEKEFIDKDWADEDWNAY